MKLSQFLCICVFGSLYCGCTSQSYVMTDEYREKEIHARQLVVAPYSVTVFDKDNASKEIGGEKTFQSVADSVLMQTFLKHGQIDTILFPHSRFKARLVDRKLPLSDDESIKLQLPKDSEGIALTPSAPAFVLFIGNYTVKEKIGHGAIPGSPGYSSTAVVVTGVQHQMDFCIWDNAKKRMVSYGKVDFMADPAPLLPASEANWSESLNALFDKILKASPFYLKNKW